MGKDLYLKNLQEQRHKLLDDTELHFCLGKNRSFYIIYIICKNYALCQGCSHFFGLGATSKSKVIYLD